VSVDNTPPVSSVTYDRTPDSCCWYVSAVKPTVTATDPEGDADVAETRCQLDGTAPASFDNLPATPCPYLAPSQYVFTEGIHKLYVASKDKAGNKEIPKTFTFKIDLQGPTSQIDPLAPFQTTNPFTVSWSGSDTVSGVKDYDVRYRQASGSGPFGPYVQWFTQTTSTSASFSAPAGTTTCFSVRARDNACWTTVKYSPEQCTTAPYDDPSLTRFGYWSTVTGSGYYGPSVSRSTTVGDKLSLSLTGSVIGVLATKQPGGGTVQLRWNGVTMSTQSLNAAAVMKKQLLTFNLSGVQTGTLEIVHSGAGTVDIDAAGAYRAS
jgi:hypothetical protein